MSKISKKLLLLGLTLILALLIGAPTSASAKTHFTKTTTPKSFRGTWECLVDFGDSGKFLKKIKITKYTFALYGREYPNGKFQRGLIWRGNKASWDNKRHSDLWVKNKKHGKWLIGGLERMTDYNTVYKIVKHHGKKALKLMTISDINYDPTDEDTSNMSYFYKK